jgi:hypothetical protein
VHLRVPCIYQSSELLTHSSAFQCLPRATSASTIDSSFTLQRSPAWQCSTHFSMHMSTYIWDFFMPSPRAVADSVVGGAVKSSSVERAKNSHVRGTTFLLQPPTSSNKRKLDSIQCTQQQIMCFMWPSSAYVVTPRMPGNRDAIGHVRLVCLHHLMSRPYVESNPRNVSVTLKRHGIVVEMLVVYASQ